MKKWRKKKNEYTNIGKKCSFANNASIASGVPSHTTGISIDNPRFKREFAVSRHQPFGKTTDYHRAIQKADPAKIAKLVKLVGILLQTKVNLFWSTNID